MSPADLKFPLEQTAVKTYLPHRAPMLFVDRVTTLSENTIQTECYIDAGWPCFEGHFPDMAIMPGVLIVEATVQAGAMLAALTQDIPKDTFLALAQLEEVKFRRPVFPGDRLVIDVVLEKRRRHIYKFSGEVNCGDERVAAAKFSAAEFKFSEGAP